MKRFACLLLGYVCGCGTDPVQAAGNYTIALTNRTNGCNFSNYTVGDTASGIPVVIAQQGANATASVNGLTGPYLDLVLGSHQFIGTVDGDALDLTLQGTRAQTMGNCTYTYDAEILATLTGDALVGRINYRPATNGHTDCVSIEGCLTYQDFNGTRPPQ